MECVWKCALSVCESRACTESYGLCTECTSWCILRGTQNGGLQPVPNELFIKVSVWGVFRGHDGICMCCSSSRMSWGSFLIVFDGW